MDLDDGSVDRMVEDGLLIAASTLRLSLKNRLIMRSMGSDRLAFNEHDFLDAARDELQQLSSQRGAEAARLAAVREDAKQRQGKARTWQDYRDSDVPALELRIAVNRRLGERLAALLEDEEFLPIQIQLAQEAAVGEIVAARVDPMVIVPGPPIERRRRLALLSRDLRRLRRRSQFSALASRVRTLMARPAHPELHHQAHGR